MARRYDHIRVHVLCPCIANSALGATSQTNKAVGAGEIDTDRVPSAEENGQVSY